MAVKINITLPEELLDHLKQRVQQRARSAFVADAVREKLRRLEQDELERALVEGYKVTAEEGRALNAEWEAITIESWPEDVDR